MPLLFMITDKYYDGPISPSKQFSQFSQTITTAKTKVARAVKREATAMADRDLYTAVLSRLALPEECPF